MNNLKFKEGDWCFCEFQLQQIAEVKEGHVTLVTNGYHMEGSVDLNDRCYPLDMKVKKISDEVKYWDTMFNSLKSDALNHNALKEELIRRWAVMCEHREDETVLKRLYKSLSDFGNSVLQKVNSLNREEVEGVKIFQI